MTLLFGGSAAVDGLAAAPKARAAKACTVSSALKRYGPTYTYKLGVRRATCKGGKNLIRSWDRCRRKRGGYPKGCRRTSGFSCSERRYNPLMSPYRQYTTDVKCKKRGGKRVNFTAKLFALDR